MVASFVGKPLFLMICRSFAIVTVLPGFRSRIVRPPLRLTRTFSTPSTFCMATRTAWAQISQSMPSVLISTCRSSAAADDAVKRTTLRNRRGVFAIIKTPETVTGFARRPAVTALESFRGRNSAFVHASTRRVERRLRSRHAKDVLPHPQQCRRRITRPLVRLLQSSDGDEQVVLRPAQTRESIIETVHHVRRVDAAVARQKRQVLDRARPFHLRSGGDTEQHDEQSESQHRGVLHLIQKKYATLTATRMCSFVMPSSRR